MAQQDGQPDRVLPRPCAARDNHEPGLPDDRDAAVAALFEAHYVRLVALSRRMLADPAGAEDVVMDAYVGLYRRWGKVRRPEDAFFYLRASVVNGSRNRLRRVGLAAARLFTQLERDMPAADEDMLRRLDHDAAVTALRSISARQRQVLVLRYYEELSETEIANTLGCSVGSVKTHAARGLHALAEKMGDR